ncbi:DUF4870 domain-containing protein [Phormidium sp. CCY1219]|uniref:DUF4870 domain-containing protein n=1 Tax=Phormidium sp. CCY1219 TaxID=2886104 RepID=UPI002D1E873F|nr:DUF4870 domain-containing protein [Phormidium sp. CCY1219]MEB3831054.1 DUF4870 domain-containing protein [Phormidium sp. CCY1219]
MYDSDKRKLFSAVSHAAIFFSASIVSFGVPIAILFVSDDPVVKENAKESINFHINIYIYAIIFGLLTLVVIGIPLLILLAVASVVMPILALVKVVSNPNSVYRYPFIFRLV